MPGPALERSNGGVEVGVGLKKLFQAAHIQHPVYLWLGIKDFELLLQTAVPVSVNRVKGVPAGLGVR